LAESGDRGSALLVIFGITGDLARKMTFRALYRLERRELLQCPVLGVASDDITKEELVNRARKAIVDSGEKLADKVFDRLADRLSYLHGDVTDPALYDSLAKRIGRKRDCLYYLEMPPSLFAPIVECLGKAGLLEQARVAVEKPFGHDLESACELNARLHAVLDEDQIFRVDHFLGKQPVVELEYLRFGNLALAELWDRRSISQVQITMAEDFGVEDRGKFYDGVGALRDVVQNHLLQVLAGVAMEPPVGPSADDLNDKKADVLRAIPALDPERCVRGQYRGYTGIDGVAKRSQTETFVALRLEIDNWRRGADLFARRQGHGRTRDRGAVVHPPRTRVSFSARPQTGRTKPDSASHRPRSRTATAVDRIRCRPLARRPPGFVVHAGLGRAADSLRAPPARGAYR
jgi:glucose-6-phosphate 1-dehydrogenase